MASNNAYGPQVITDGLAWCVDANSPRSYPGGGGIYWYDLSSSKQAVSTLTNGPSFVAATDTEPAHMLFDATNEYIAHPDLASFNNVSVEIVFKTTDKNSEMFGLSTTTSTTAPNAGFCTLASGDQVFFFRFNSAYDNSGTTGGANWNDRPYKRAYGTYTADVWKHYVGTYTQVDNQVGDVIALYENGKLVDISDQSNTPASQYAHQYESATFQGGLGGGTSAGYHFLGSVAFVRVYTRALTPVEVKQNFNSTRSRFGL